MGIFHKKRDHIHDSSPPYNFTTLTRDRISDFSHKSPRLITTVKQVPVMVNSIPDIDIPRPPEPSKRPAEYLRSIHAVRERSKIVLQKAKNDRLNHFDVDMTKFKDTADYVVSIIKVVPNSEVEFLVLTCTARF